MDSFRDKMILIVCIALLLTAFPFNFIDVTSKDNANQVHFESLSDNETDLQEYINLEDVLRNKIVSGLSVSKVRAGRRGLSVVLFVYLVISLFFGAFIFYWIIRPNNSINISKFYIIRYIHDLDGKK